MDDSSPPYRRLRALVTDAGESMLTVIGAVMLAWIAASFIVETTANSLRIKAATWLRHARNQR